MILSENGRKENYSIGTTNAEISANELVRTRIEKDVNILNQSFGQWEQIKRFELVDHIWTPEAGELTPTLKPKRRVLMEIHQDLYKRIYG